MTVPEVTFASVPEVTVPKVIVPEVTVPEATVPEVTVCKCSGSDCSGSNMLSFVRPRSDPEHPNDAVLVWGDTGGWVTTIHFSSADIALFERPSQPADEKQGQVIAR